MELDAVVQMKNVSQRIGNFPAFGEARCNVEIVAPGEQVVKD